LAPGPLGSVAGDLDRHRGGPLCPSSVPAAGGRGLRPRVPPARRPWPHLQAQDSVMGRRPIVGIAYIQTGKGFLLSSHFHNLASSCADSDCGAPARVNQGRGSLFRHNGCTTQ
jgi:hypothetical protein